MTTLSPQELRNKGIKALSDALGPVDMARFLMQFDKGEGDYTKERHKWLDKYSIDEIVGELGKNQEDTADD
jgi:hypothetical protein